MPGARRMNTSPRQDLEDHSSVKVLAGCAFAVFGFVLTIFALYEGSVALLLPGCAVAGLFIFGFWSTFPKTPDVLRQWLGLVDLHFMPIEIIDPIRPLLPANTRYISSTKLRELYEHATRLMVERERHARRSAGASQHRSSASWCARVRNILAALSADQRALLAFHLETKATARMQAPEVPKRQQLRLLLLCVTTKTR